jgi:hypothetical protein
MTGHSYLATSGVRNGVRDDIVSIAAGLYREGLLLAGIAW